MSSIGAHRTYADHQLFFGCTGRNWSLPPNTYTAHCLSTVRTRTSQFLHWERSGIFTRSTYVRLVLELKPDRFVNDVCMSVLCSPAKDTLHGAGCPNSIKVQQLGGSVTMVLDFGIFRKVVNPLRTVLNYGRWVVCRYFYRASD